MGPFTCSFATRLSIMVGVKADCLFALSLALTGAALKFFNILFNRGEVMAFSSVVASLEVRFG